MTLASERIKQAHRGFRRAEPASRSRLAALETFGLRYVRVDDFNVVVEGDYQLNLAMSYWRSVDGTSQGYLVSTLHAEIAKTNSEKPVAGRDSIANPADSDRAAELTFDPVAMPSPRQAPLIANEAAEGSMSLLPAVWP
jgi:hypothetical protein